jgi:hypothetical protein
MASGKPLVSVEIEEAIRYKEVISIAKNKEEFCRALEWELKNDTDDRRNKRIDIASAHSWRCHVDQINQLFQQTLLKRIK